MLQMQFPADAEPQEQDELHTHLVILVHGCMGTERDLAYFESTLRGQAHPESKMIIHRSSCNIIF
jgi:hypothetical protein